MSYEDTGIVPKLVLLHLERRRLELINFIVIKLFLNFFDIMSIAARCRSVCCDAP